MKFKVVALLTLMVASALSQYEEEASVDDDLADEDLYQVKIPVLWTMERTEDSLPDNPDDLELGTDKYYKKSYSKNSGYGSKKYQKADSYEKSDSYSSYPSYPTYKDYDCENEGCKCKCNCDDISKKGYYGSSGTYPSGTSGTYPSGSYPSGYSAPAADELSGDEDIANDFGSGYNKGYSGSGLAARRMECEQKRCNCNCQCASYMSGYNYRGTGHAPATYTHGSAGDEKPEESVQSDEAKAPEASYESKPLPKPVHKPKKRPMRTKAPTRKAESNSTKPGRRVRRNQRFRRGSNKN